MVEMDQNFNKVFWDACANGDFPMVCSQIKAGADVNYQNGDGRTALMRASKRDRKDVVQVLLDNGADVNISDNKGKTALMTAAKKGNKTILKALNKPESLITYVKDRPGHDLRYAIDCSKMERDLGWKPKTLFREGIKTTVKWYLDNTEWLNNITYGDDKKYYEEMYQK